MFGIATFRRKDKAHKARKREKYGSREMLKLQHTGNLHSRNRALQMPYPFMKKPLESMLSCGKYGIELSLLKHMNMYTSALGYS